MIAMSVHRNPPHSGRVYEFKLSHEVGDKPILGGLLTYLTFCSSSNHVCCMIINCSLDGYIRTMPASLRNILLFFVFLLSLMLSLDVCPLSMKYCSYPYYELWSTMQVCNLVHAHARLLILWENINNDTLNTSR